MAAISAKWAIQSETAVHSTVAILLYRFHVMLASRNVFHVVSALQSMVQPH